LGAQWLDNTLLNSDNTATDDSDNHDDDDDDVHVCVCATTGALNVDEKLTFVVVPPAEQDSTTTCNEQTVFGLQLDSSMFVCPEGLRESLLIVCFSQKKIIRNQRANSFQIWFNCGRKQSDRIMSKLANCFNRSSIDYSTRNQSSSLSRRLRLPTPKQQTTQLQQQQALNLRQQQQQRRRRRLVRTMSMTNDPVWCGKRAGRVAPRLVSQRHRSPPTFTSCPTILGKTISVVVVAVVI
jgi:hypothetical protein